MTQGSRKVIENRSNSEPKLGSLRLDLEHRRAAVAVSGFITTSPCSRAESFDVPRSREISVGGISSGKSITNSFSGASRTARGSLTTSVAGAMRSSRWVVVI